MRNPCDLADILPLTKVFDHNDVGAVASISVGAVLVDTIVGHDGATGAILLIAFLAVFTLHVSACIAGVSD